MNARELRIGNYLEDSKGRICRVSELNETKITAPAMSGSTTSIPNKPIPLTEEWLLRFGFKKNENDEPQIDTNEGSALSISMRHTPYKYTAWHVVKQEFKYWIISECKFVHQLQNLYFALTGEELKLKQPKQ